MPPIFLENASVTGWPPDILAVRVYAWRNLSKFAKTLQKGQLVTLEGILRYREGNEVKGTTFKHRIAEVHAISMKRLSKVEAADDPSDGADDE
jgi:single-strand DNA-binding protein